jgi:hypothetical protein
MALTGTDLLLIGRGAVNYKATAADLATFVLSDGTIGLGLNITGRIVKVSIPVASVPPAVGALAAQAVDGSLYWDDNLGQLFIRYANSGGAGGPVWVAAAPPAAGGGGGGVTSLAVTAPITNTGTATAPIIGIAPATTAAAGSLSGADKTKIDALPSTIVASVTGSTPIVIAGTAANPDVTISTATTGARGAVQLATAAEAATGTDASKVLTPAFAVPKTPADMTGALYLPGGNDGARPAAATGLLRYNSQGGTPVDLEYYDGAAWTQLATGGGGGTLFAWARTNSTPGLIASGNISAVAFGGGGLTFTFTNPAPNANYAVLLTSAVIAETLNYISLSTTNVVVRNQSGNANAFSIAIVI